MDGFGWIDEKQQFFQEDLLQVCTFIQLQTLNDCWVIVDQLSYMIRDKLLLERINFFLF